MQRIQTIQISEQDEMTRDRVGRKRRSPKRILNSVKRELRSNEVHMWEDIAAGASLPSRVRSLMK